MRTTIVRDRHFPPKCVRCADRWRGALWPGLTRRPRSRYPGPFPRERTAEKSQAANLPVRPDPGRAQKLRPGRIGALCRLTSISVSSGASRRCSTRSGGCYACTPSRRADAEWRSLHDISHGLCGRRCSQRTEGSPSARLSFATELVRAHDVQPQDRRATALHVLMWGGHSCPQPPFRRQAG